jgi:hypothetical protein
MYMSSRRLVPGQSESAIPALFDCLISYEHFRGEMSEESEMGLSEKNLRRLLCLGVVLRLSASYLFARFLVFYLTI